MSSAKADEPIEIRLGHGLVLFQGTMCSTEVHIAHGKGQWFFCEGGGRDKCNPLPTEQQHDAVVEQAPAHAETVNDRAPVFQRRRRRR